MKYVNFLFHIYQPPLQENHVLDQIVQETYEPLTRVIRDFRDLRFTLNVNFSLVELLNERSPQVIENIRAAYENGTLELTATGAYHPIFPLIPQSEVQRQLDLNQQGNRSLLAPTFQPEGVFPPELALTSGLVSLFKSLGYKWTIADDGNLGYLRHDVPYGDICSFNGFAVFYRSNCWANQFADHHGQWTHGAEFVADLLRSLDSWMGDDDGYVVIALDGETFGHHHRELNEVFLRELCEALRDARDRLETAHLSTLYHRFPLVSQFIPPGSWSTNGVDLQRRDYFSWWKGRENKIQELQWRFTTLVLKKVRGLAANPELNAELDRALYSCQYWWASDWKFSPGEVYKGAFNMMRILQKAAGRRSDRVLEEGEALFRDLITEVEKKRHPGEK